VAGALACQPYYFHVPIILKSGSLSLLEPSGSFQTCTGIAFAYSDLLGAGQSGIWSWGGGIFFFGTCADWKDPPSTLYSES